MQGPLGDIGRHRYFKELKQMGIKFTRGAMQGPFGDIGRHGDSKTNIAKLSFNFNYNLVESYA